MLLLVLLLRWFSAVRFSSTSSATFQCHFPLPMNFICLPSHYPCLLLFVSEVPASFQSIPYRFKYFQNFLSFHLLKGFSKPICIIGNSLLITAFLLSLKMLYALSVHCMQLFFAYKFSGSNKSSTKVADTVLHVLLQQSVLPGCPLSGKDRDNFLSRCNGSGALMRPPWKSAAPRLVRPADTTKEAISSEQSASNADSVIAPSIITSSSAPTK